MTNYRYEGQERGWPGRNRGYESQDQHRRWLERQGRNGNFERDRMSNEGGWDPDYESDVEQQFGGGQQQDWQRDRNRQHERGRQFGGNEEYRGNQQYGADQGYGEEYGGDQLYRDWQRFNRAGGRDQQYGRDDFGGRRSYGSGSQYGGSQYGGRSFSGGQRHGQPGGHGQQYSGEPFDLQEDFGGAPSRGWQQYGRQSARGRFSGLGPKGWKRSDERVLEDVQQALEDHGEIDASEIEVKCQNGEIVLSGSVCDRRTKRLAEDAAEDVTGVKDVRNELRVTPSQQASSQQSASKGGESSWSQSGGQQSTTKQRKSGE